MAANRIKRIIQFSAGFNPGDAISNEMLMLKSYFQEIGFLGEIYSENIGKDTNGLAKNTILTMKRNLILLSIIIPFIQPY